MKGAEGLLTLSYTLKMMTFDVDSRADTSWLGADPIADGHKQILVCSDPFTKLFVVNEFTLGLFDRLFGDDKNISHAVAKHRYGNSARFRSHEELSFFSDGQVRIGVIDVFRRSPHVTNLYMLHAGHAIGMCRITGEIVH